MRKTLRPISLTSWTASSPAATKRRRSGGYTSPRAMEPDRVGPSAFQLSKTRCVRGRLSWCWRLVYEQDFLPCSYGFRPGRSAHQALQELRTGFMSHGLRWVIDLDIEKYFDSISHSHLRSFLDRRVTDGVIRRMIDKWLKAGVLEDGLLRHATEGSPQGGVVSPCLSNIFLHHVLDEWFENEVKPRLKGRSTLVRFADDAVMAFADYRDAQRVLGVLGKRLARYELTLHPDKTRFVDFRINRPDGKDHPETDGTSFTFLGFCHVWGKSRKGKNVVRQVTAKNRYARALAAVARLVPETPASADPRAARPSGRADAGPLCLLRHNGQLSTTKLVRPSGRKDLAEMAVAAGSQRRLLWGRFEDLLKRYPLPPPRIVHRYTAVSEALP